MGVLAKIFLTFLVALTTLLVGIIRKNKLLKMMALVLFIISATLFLLVMNALGEM